MTDTDPLWYKDAIIYQAHVRAYHDSDGDGYGDFRGLTQKLDYLQDLGITAIWILPFYPSPLKDDGYDIADYTTVHQQYGRLEDFQEFLTEAHRRGIRVITELVINHTSDQHSWFQRARHAPPGSPERNYYVWSDTPEKYKEARIIFKDFEPSNWTWDRVAGQYYWHRFYSHQPDLNFDNPEVWNALFPILDQWVEMGVDGMRLDAIPYLYEREGTNCENLPETHAYLKALRCHMDEKFPGRMFLAEANQWPEDAVAYFGDGDECHMAFHFPVMPRLYMALHQEDRFPIIDILDQTPPIPPNCQWCMFLRNHDELTLEMVTDEERDYMYRAYAEDRTARINLGIRRRLAPLLKNDRRRIELMNALLFSMPGTPVIYYGDEIGMGDNIYLGDRNGVRTPMQWSGDRNAGFSRANPQKLYSPVIIDPEYHYETVNVEAQQNNPSSLLWWMKRLIDLRKRFKAFGRGSIKFLRPANPKVLAFIREYEAERIMVVANLSRFVQFAELDLREYAGVAPEELFGRTLFPRIGELPYLLTMGPHSFFWFSLPIPTPEVVDTAPIRADAGPPLPVLRGDRPVAERFEPTYRDDLEALLPAFLNRRRVGPTGAEVTSAQIQVAFRTSPGDVPVWFLFIQAEFRVGNPEAVSLPVAFLPDEALGELAAPLADAGIARVGGSTPGLICDALAIPVCCREVVKAILTGRVRRVEGGEIASLRFPAAEADSPTAVDGLPVTVHRSDRNNVSIVLGDRYVLKTFRRVEEVHNPAVEVGRFLTEREFAGAVPVIGAIEYRRRGSEPATLAVLHRYVPHETTAWQHVLDQLSRFFERVAALSRETAPRPPDAPTLVGPDGPGTEPDGWREMVGESLETARLLGLRTAELHRALASNTADPGFIPEPFGKLYQRSAYQSMRNAVGRLCRRLEAEGHRLHEPARELATRLVRSEQALLRRFRGFLTPDLGGTRIRVHGDYHLARLLYTGKNFVLIDFRGDTSRPVGERRIKRSPLRDVASMIRSFDYAARLTLRGEATSRGRPQGVIRPEDVSWLEPWAAAWTARAAREYVTSYLEAIQPSRLLPPADDGKRILLELLTLEKALHEAELELDNRPDWAAIPLRGALHILGEDAAVEVPAVS
jgi:maltose alpha-D-glucosyltransferase/alpha-amylase